MFTVMLPVETYINVPTFRVITSANRTVFVRVQDEATLRENSHYFLEEGETVSQVYRNIPVVDLENSLFCERVLNVK